ncbi:hypothetical protein IAD21_00548 [Abditibacteriota bacterium]|nr:hypothetical protein IAD21_00548 [Abditibacteriota bacterium]
MRKQATQEEKDGMVAAYLSGATADEAGAIFGYSDKPVFTALRHRGINSRPSVRRNALTPEIQARAVELYAGGMSLAEVSTHVKRGKTRIREILIKSGVERRCDVGGRPRATTLEQDAEVLALYESGKSCREASRSMGFASEGVCRRVLRNKGVKTRPMGKLSASQRREICARSIKGETPTSLASEFGVTYGAIIALMEKHGIPRKDAGFPRKHVFDFDFFEVIDSEDKAYWLGFIAADGCVHKGNSLSIGLAGIDIEHLRKFAVSIGLSTWEPRIVKSRLGFESVRLTVTSPKMVLDLRKWGIVQRKSHCLEWPEFLSSELLRHYLRGYIDGDGSWPQAKDKDWPYFSLCGFPGFILCAQDFMVKECGVRRGKLNYRGDNFCTMGNSAQRDVRKLARFFYGDASTFLDRKRKKVECFL